MTRALATVLGVLLLAPAAAANQPPGPMVALPEILLLPIMMLLSLAGGAYAVRRRLGLKRRVFWLALAAVFVILFAGVHEGFGVMVAVLFAVIAVSRGARMVYWGWREPAYIGEISRARLVVAGSALVMIASALGATAVAFVGYWPQESIMTTAAEEFAAGQFRLYAEEGRYREPGSDDPGFGYLRGGLRGGTWRCEVREDGTGFTLWVTPQATFPSAPFHLLTTQPSLRVDETGAVRMIRVREAGVLCPPDAPVVLVVYGAPARPGR